MGAAFAAKCRNISFQLVIRMIRSFKVGNVVDIQDFGLLVGGSLFWLRLLKIVFVVDLLLLINIHVFDFIQIVANVVIDFGDIEIAMMRHLDLRNILSLWHCLYLGRCFGLNLWS